MFAVPTKSALAQFDPVVHKPHTAGCLTQFSTWMSEPKHAVCVC